MTEHSTKDTGLQRIENQLEKGNTRSLPGDERLVTPIRITCAEHERMDSGLQRVGDHIRLTKLDPGRHKYNTDRELQTNLIEFLRGKGIDDPEKPMRVPIHLTSDTIEHSLFRRLAMYRGTGQAVCSCGAFTEKSPEKLQQQGIKRAVGETGIKGREYFEGIYTRQIFNDSGHLLDVRTGHCDPATCPFMIGDRAEAEAYKREYYQTYGHYPKSGKIGQVMCKPQIKLTVAIADIADNMSPVAVLSSTSWNTGRQLNRILTKIKEATGGLLCGLPLWLVLQFVQTSGPDGKTRTIPVWTIEPRGFPWKELPGKASAIEQQRLQSAQYRDDTRALMDAEVRGLPAGREFVREFHPEAADGEGEDTDPKQHLQYLAADILGWSESEVSDLMEKCEESGEWDKHIRHLSTLAEARARGKAEKLDIPVPDTQGEAVEDDSELEPDGPPDIPCPDDIGMFPTSRDEWADGLRAVGWDAPALKGALSYTGYSKLPEITDDTDPSTLWPVMLAINWYAHAHGLEDPLEPVFNDVDIRYAGDAEDVEQGGDEPEADDAPEDFDDNIQEGEWADVQLPLESETDED